MSELSSILGQHFTYAAGRLGVLRQVLLTQADTDRMLGASDRKDVERILTELKFTSMIDQGLGSGEEILHGLGKWIRNEVNTMCPEAKRATFNILWLQGDAPLLSFLLKKRCNLTSSISSEPLSGISAYDDESLHAYIHEGDGTALPAHLTEFIDGTADCDKITPQEIDAAVAQYIANTQLRLARASGSKLIKRYVRHTIDLQNIRTALRSYDDDVRNNALVRGGTIAPEDLMGENKDVLAAISRSNLPYDLSAKVENASEDPIALERRCSDVLAEDIADMWNIPMSVEPLFAFAAIGISDLFLIRSILIAKGNGLTPQETKRILPPFIPATHFIA